MFAYGQTGSGKTYSMFGDDLYSEKRGIVSRSLEDIFDLKSRLERIDRDFEYTIKMQFF